MQSFRTAQDNGDVDFGQNLIARNSGVIRIGDEVEILATAPAKIYGAAAADDTVNITQQPDANVDIDWQGQAFRGNNQQVLLEQLENQEFVSLFLPRGHLWKLPCSAFRRRSHAAEKISNGR